MIPKGCFKTVLLTIYLYVCFDSKCNASSVTAGVSSLFEYQTAELLENNDEGIAAAFGDFDANGLVDIFVITNNSQVHILLAQENKAYKKKFLIGVNNTIITSVAPADYDGDVQMDVLITTSNSGDKTPAAYKVSIYWGYHANYSIDPQPLVFQEEFRDEPMLFDFNEDMIPDLLSEPSGTPGTRQVWLGSSNRTYSAVEFPKADNLNNATITPFAVPHSHAFVDINNDMSADLLLTTETGYEVWLNVNGEYKYHTEYDYPPSLKDGVIGMSSFADLECNQMLQHVLPGCIDKECTQSVVFMLNSDKREWKQIMGRDAFYINEKMWGFVPPEDSQFIARTKQKFYVMLRIGDYNLDGFPDAVAVLRNRSGSVEQQRRFVFDNVPCHDTCPYFNRTLEINKKGDVSVNNDRVMVATFYDIYEDGTPDIVMVVMPEDETNPKIVLLKNDVASEDCFVKITVVSGLCTDNCGKPYGVNYPGPSVGFSMTNTDGSILRGTGSQLSQTAHFSLQTPYQTFGLGSTPNFIDEMKIGIPKEDKETGNQRAWPFIIPNSQLIVIPRPPNKPGSWMLKLYVTPSQLLYVTGATLLGTCGFIAIIVAILHWREKREDLLEKKQEAQRFHFDAM